MKNNKIIICGRSGGNYHNNKLFSQEYAYFTHNKKKIYREDKNIGLNNLKKKINNEGFALTTTDVIKNYKICDVEMHFFGSFEKRNAKYHYCILPEIKEVAKNCEINLLKKKYDKIFTNIEDNIDNKKVFFINLPQSNKCKKIFLKKKKIFCIFANNKSLNCYTKYSGYVERVRLINWFLKNYPDTIDIYGENWNTFYSENYYLNRFVLLLKKKLNLKKVLSKNFKGFAKYKIPILSRYKYNFCFENYYGSKGYFTEKIFDSFYAGTVPIYLGCLNVEKYLPSNVFINFKKFRSFNELYMYINSINEKKYLKFQNNIVDFLSSKNFNKFHYNRFSKTIISHIKKDLDLKK